MRIHWKREGNVRAQLRDENENNNYQIVLHGSDSGVLLKLTLVSFLNYIFSYEKPVVKELTNALKF